MADLKKILEREMAKSDGKAKFTTRHIKLTKEELESIKHNENEIKAQLKSNETMRYRSLIKASNQFLG